MLLALVRRVLQRREEGQLDVSELFHDKAKFANFSELRMTL
jgi:hypothetical protein